MTNQIQYIFIETYVVVLQLHSAPLITSDVFSKMTDSLLKKIFPLLVIDDKMNTSCLGLITFSPPVHHFFFPHQ